MRSAPAFVFALALIPLLAPAPACAPRRDPCTQEELHALRGLYDKAAAQVIFGGACDRFQRVEQCPAYMAVELDFKLTAKALCR